MELIRKVIDIGSSSRAVIIPSEFFESVAIKGKTFKKVRMTLNDKIVLDPVLEDIEKR